MLHRFFEGNERIPDYELSVVVGAHRIIAEEDSQVRHQVRRTVLQERYNISRPRLHDIAVVELNTSIQYSEKVRPICVDESEFRPRFKCIVTGWGSIDPDGMSTNLR